MTPSSTPDSILVVDDEESVLSSIKRTLRVGGFSNVTTCSDSRKVASMLGESDTSLMLLDLNMPHMGGEDVLAQVAEDHPALPVIVVTADYDARVAVRCMKLGAVDYLLKPVDDEQLIACVQRALEQSALRYEAALLREQFFAQKLKHPECFASIITEDPGMFRLFAYLEAIARGSQAALIEGETGTGKELIAAALHGASNRDGPFVAVNVAGLDDTMFSDTLFGHVAGAYTGAAGKREGMVAAAGTGTLFLDEVGELSEASQVKLLRLLQEREYHPLGSDSVQRLHARVIAATHKKPDALRQDLYFRLRAYRVVVPPLRERMGDLPLLVSHFVKMAAEDLEKTEPDVSAELYVHLSRYRFPGNIRELRSMVFDAVARHEEGELSVQPFLDLMQDPIPSEETGTAGDAKTVLSFPYPMPELKDIEDAAIAEAIARGQGNHSAAARMLGVARQTISRRAGKARDESDQSSA